MKAILRSGFLALAILAVSVAPAWTQIAFVKDGDDIVIDGRDYRLEGVDAFELGQKCHHRTGQSYNCGAEAKAALEAIIGGLPVRCIPTGKRSNKRYVEVELVRSGWALVRPDFLSQETAARLCAIEAEAAASKRGAWAGTFNLPYFHKGGRKKTREDVAC